MGTNKFSIRKRWLKNIWEKNVTTAFNFLYAKKEKIYSAYVSKHNSYCEKQVILLMIPNEEKRKAKSKGRKGKSKGREAKSEGW